MITIWDGLANDFDVWGSIQGISSSEMITIFKPIVLDQIVKNTRNGVTHQKHLFVVFEKEIILPSRSQSWLSGPGLLRPATFYYF